MIITYDIGLDVCTWLTTCHVTLLLKEVSTLTFSEKLLIFYVSNPLLLIKASAGL